jgi:hypothetical protein
MSTLSNSRDLGKANQTPMPRRLALALGMSVPAVLALVPLARPPDYYEILVSGSQELLIRNCALVVLIPYVLVAFAGLGNLVLLFITAVTGRPLHGRFHHEALIGLALAHPLVMAIFLLGIGARTVTSSLFLFLVFWFFFMPNATLMTSATTGLSLLQRPRVTLFRAASSLRTWVNVVIAVAVSILVVSKGLSIEGYSDILQLYLPYFNEASALGSTQMQAQDPAISSFVVGRGAGLHLLVTSLATGYATQIASVCAVILIGLLFRCTITEMGLQLPAARRGAVNNAAGVAMVGVVSFSLTQDTFGKTHLVALCLMLTFVYFCALLVSAAQPRALGVVGSTAAGIGLVTLYVPYFTVVIGCAGLFLLIASLLGRWTTAVALTVVLAVVAVAAVASTVVNFAVIGVGGFEPMIRNFVNPAIFDRYSSWSLWQYMNDAQNLVGPLGGFLKANITTVGLNPFHLIGEGLAYGSSTEIVQLSIIAAALALMIARRRWFLITALTVATYFALTLQLAVLLLMAFCSVYLLTLLPALSLYRRVSSSHYTLSLPLGRALPLLSLTVFLAGMLFLFPWIAQPSLGRFLAQGQLLPFVIPAIALAFIAARPFPTTDSIGKSTVAPTRQDARTFEVFPITVTLLVIATVSWWVVVFDPSTATGQANKAALFEPFSPITGLPVSLALLIAAFSIPAVISLFARRTSPTGSASKGEAVMQGEEAARRKALHGITWALLIAETLLIVGVMVASNSKAIFQDPVKDRSVSLGESLTIASGRVGALAGSEVPQPWWFTPLDVERCLEIERLVPQGSTVFPMNGTLALSLCHGTPGLDRGRLIHHYESVLAPYFSQIVNGTPEEVADVFRRLGISYFVLLDHDCNVWSFASSKLFSNAALLQLFDVYARGSDMTILRIKPGQESTDSPTSPARGTLVLPPMSGILEISGATTCDR